MTKVPRGEDPSAEVSSKGGEGRGEGTEVGEKARALYSLLLRRFVFRMAEASAKRE